MIRRLLFALLGLSTLYWPSYLFAQEKALSLNDCLLYALNENTRLDIQELNFQKAKVERQKSLALLYPQLDFRAKFTDNIELPPITVPGEVFGKPNQLLSFHFGTQYNANIGLDLQQQLFNAPLFLQGKLGNYHMENAQLGVDQIEEDMLYQVAQTFYQIQLSQQAIQLNEDQFGLLDSLINLMVISVEQGNAIALDLKRLKVQQTNIETGIQRAELNLLKSNNSMKLLINWPLNSPLNLSDESLDWQDTTAFYFDENRMTQLKSANTKMKITTTQLQMAHRNKLPILYAFSNFSYQNMHDKFSNFINGSWDVGFAIGLGVEFSVFKGFSKQKDVTLLKLDLEQLKWQKQNLLHQLKSSFIIADQEMAIQQQNLKSQKENYDLAREVELITSEQFLYGTASIADFLNAQNAFRQAYINYLNAVFSFRMAQIQALYASGQINKLLKAN